MNCYTSKYGNKYYCLNPIIPNKTYYEGPNYISIEKDSEKNLLQRNLLHRIDGPSFEGNDGYKEWHYRGEQIFCKNNEEFIKIIKMKAFI